MLRDLIFVHFILAFLLIGILGCDDSPTDANDDLDLEEVIEINTIEELQKIGNEDEFPADWDYELGSDIDASATAEWNDGAGFEPISENFTGTLKGNNYEIQDLTINRPGHEGYVAIFERVQGDDAEISNMSITGVNISADDVEGVGALAGILWDGEFRNIHVEGNIMGNRDVGLIAGWNETEVSDLSSEGEIQLNEGEEIPSAAGGIFGGNGGNISNSHAHVDITSDSDNATNLGGLIGWNSQSGVIEESYATGSVSNGERNLGGLVGWNNGIVYASFATGDVSGNSRVGGLIGDSFVQSETVVIPKISESYATGDVTGTGDAEYIGGLIGSSAIQEDHEVDGIHNVYATGTVTGDPETTGGLIGSNGGITDVHLAYEFSTGYWNTETTEQESDVGVGLSGENARGLNTEQMQGDAAEENMSDLDFEDTWQTVSEDYPALWWQ